jgi:hypothetical protein
MNEKEFASTLKGNEKDKVERVCAILREHKITIQDALIDFVAALCDVDKDKMMNASGMGDSSLAYARWFYWYANKVLTGDTYKKMSEDSGRQGKKVTLMCVMKGALKMSAMIENIPIWRKRWIIMKRVIRESEYNGVGKADNSPIKIVAPKNIEIEIQKK